MIFQTNNIRFFLQVPDDLLTLIRAYIGQASNIETGGIIIGRYNSELDTAIITNFSDAPKDSKVGPYWFSRGIAGLRDLLVNYWKHNEYYLGEWHFHPNAAPNPSKQDERQMKKIASTITYKCPEPILIIVGGNSERISIRAFVFPEYGRNMFELFEVKELIQ